MFAFVPELVKSDKGDARPELSGSKLGRSVCSMRGVDVER